MKYAREQNSNIAYTQVCASVRECVCVQTHHKGCTVANSLAAKVFELDLRIRAPLSQHVNNLCNNCDTFFLSTDRRGGRVGAELR